MNSRFSYILLGLFVLGLGAALIGGVLWLSTGGLVQPDYARYVVYTTESVSGLSVDSRVTYKGVEVGQVAEMVLVPERPDVVKLVLEVREDTPIKEDTVAKLQMQGLTGLSTINLSGGTAGSPPLVSTPGEPYPVIDSVPSLYGQLGEVLTELVQKITVISEQVNSLLSAENRQRLERTLSHVEKISGTFAGRADQLEGAFDDLAAALRNARSASRDVPKLVEQFRATAGAVEMMAREIENTGATVRQQVVAGGETLERVENRMLPQTQATLEALRETADNLRQMSEQLRRDPSVLMYGAPPARPGPGE